MAKQILIFGAGRSSAALVNYLIERAEENEWKVVVTDREITLPEERVKSREQGQALAIDALDPDVRRPLIQDSDLVISMLPARFHIDVIKDCIEFKKPIIAPSYITEEINTLNDEAKAAGIPVLMEIGLDPGIDHMSAMEVIDRIRNEGGNLMRFESFTGGLVAPDSDNNPWNYKFTWNPRNVVLAGQGGAARFIQEGHYKYIPPYMTFTRTKPIEIEGYGSFEGYANRDSLKYKDVYQLGDIPTIYRGTLRRAGFCEAWNTFVMLGMTDDSYEVEDCHTLTWRLFANLFLSYSEDKPVEQKLQEYTGCSDEVMEKLKWLGLFDDTPVGMDRGTPAQLLQKLLESKWSLEPDDKDMIVMWHRFNYELEGEENEIHASMVAIGDDTENTAMAKTVGLPVAIATRLILQDKLHVSGVLFPTHPEIYEPILEELKNFGVTFNESKVV